MTPVDLDGAILVRSRWSGAAALASFAVIVAALVLAVLDSPIAIAGIYAFYPLAISLALHLGWTRSTRRLASIRVSGKSVLANGEVVRARVASTRIIAQPKGRGAVVELRRRFDPYPARVALTHEEDARKLVRALGLDPREGTTRFRTPLSTFATVAIVLIATLGSAILLPLLGLPLGLLAVLASAIGLVRFSTSTITIGQDGILIEGFPRKRFVPYANIVSMEREVRTNHRGPMVSRGFWVTLDSGERIFVNTMHERMRDYMFQGDHLFDAANAAHEAARAARSGVADILARGGRTTTEWLRELDGTREARYRVAAISDEQLELVLANPNADKTARIGAAICLARAGDETRAKVRVAVEDIAAPDVRAAALAALEEDEEALAATLEALE